MGQIDIVKLFTQDSFFVVTADHYHDDGRFWYREDYQWFLKEGTRQKRATNLSGEILLSDDTVAPYRIEDGKSVQYLPEGKRWKWLPPPHMGDNSIWDTITEDHKRRRAQRYKGGINRLSRKYISGERQDALKTGRDTLLTRFRDIVGESVIV